VASQGRERLRLNSSTASRIEEIMFVRACGDPCVMPSAATLPKWDYSSIRRFDGLYKALV
jgi:hypothetical protein